MGTLSLSADHQSAADILPESGTIQTATGVERLHGRKLDTELHIVLENITHGFSKPNVLDLKLGAQLWDEGAKPEKRARLDAVSAETTSGSLGFRIAGMRTYMPSSTSSESSQKPEIPSDLKDFVEDNGSSFWVYNKMYGRSKLSTSNITDGFWAYILPNGRGNSSKRELQRAAEVLGFFLAEVTDIQKAFERKESRMYSASILLVYEGDIDAYEKTREKLASTTVKAGNEDEGDEEDEGGEEEEDLPKLAAVKVIDFAHATWQPGRGPDENAIRGMRSTGKILEELSKEMERELGN
jgi:1D-myo-inositol-tetrakisphosphate 5-kinase/inositol-polyphosphate multikinase